MPKSPQELGSKSPFKLRVGIDIPTWKGVNKEGDPGTISPDEFQHAFNVRILPSGALVCRGGQEKVNSTPLDSCVMGAFDDEVPFGASGAVWWVGGSGETASYINTAGLSVDVVPDLSGVMDSASWQAATVFNSELLYVFNNGAVTQLRRWDPEASASSLVYNFAMTQGQCEGLAVANGILYIPLWDYGATNNLVIHAWNGTTIASSKTFVAATAGGMCASYGDEPYFVWSDSLGNATPNAVWRLHSGAWASLAMPAVTDFNCQDWSVYAGALYLGGIHGMPTYSAVILKWDGATLTLAREIGDKTLDHWTIRAMTADDETLYYGLYDGTPLSVTNENYVGTYDGSTWTNHAKDLTAQFGQPLGSDNNVTTLMFVQDGRVYVAAYPFNIAPTGVLRSGAGAIDDDWERVGPFYGTAATSQAKAYI